MKLTRRQLRRLINEATIKPSIPNIPSDTAYTKIDDLARQSEFQPSADSIAGAFGYPEERSYSEDLRTYDTAARATFDTPLIQSPPGSEAKVVHIPVPYELVDAVIKKHQVVSDLQQSGGFIGSAAADTAWSFRTAAMQVYYHIDKYLDEKYSPYMLDTYGFEGAHGYRAEEYNKAMEAAGEYI